jgi:putative addiction module component (TIGR02574 family)
METLPDDDPALEADVERWRASLPPWDEPPIISMCLDESDDAADPAPDPLPLTDAGRTLLDAALARPVLDRAIIAEVLHETLPPPPGFVPVTEEELIAELNRRREEGERDPSSCIPWEQVRDR